MLEREKHYTLSEEESAAYRNELNSAAGTSNAEILKASNNDWRYRIARWMLRVSAEPPVVCCFNPHSMYL
jgi:hypothetical protein